MEHFDAEIVADADSEFSLQDIINLRRNPLRERDTPPPAKRRRTYDDLSHESHAFSQPPDSAGYATLIDISINLRRNLRTPPPSPPGGNDGENGPIRVYVRDVRSVESEGYCCALLIAPCESKTPIICGLTIKSNRLDELRARLSQIETTNPVNANGSTSKFSAVTWSHCLLHRKPNDSSSTFVLEAKVFWKLDVSATSLRLPKLHQLLAHFLPSPAPLVPSLWSPQDFYENVHVPSKDLKVSAAIQSPLMTCRLYPFQCRAVHWLLEREGKFVNEEGAVVPIADLNVSVSSSSESFVDADGKSLHVNRLLGEITSDPFSKEYNISQLRGGILSEEMGLGKTVELIALMLLNQRQKFDLPLESNIIPCGATLIITPPAILEQWRNEIQSHAPSLKIHHYRGVKQYKMKEKELQDLLLDQDVVLTTYGVLAGEIFYANEAPERSMRHEKKYKARRTPLVQIQWWRVCLDEAQMIESGVSNAAKVARLIPRVNAWAVSGTPLRKNVSDLYGLILFLGCEPYLRQDVWTRLIDNFKAEFAEVFSLIALRHNKSDVREELRLPPQKRIVVTLPFTAIEEQNYTQIFQRMCEDVGVDEIGAPTSDSWDPNQPSIVEKMRSWLNRLRQTCLHADMGIRNKRMLGTTSGPMRTIYEVLDNLVEQNETALRGAERLWLTSMIMRGHLHSFGRMPGEALSIYLVASDEAERVVKDCREHLTEQQNKASESQNTTNEVKNRQNGINSDFDVDGDGTVNDGNGQVVGAKQRLRSALTTLHMGLFFSATAYFQCKEDATLIEPDSERFRELEEKETGAYEAAKMIRKELLTEVAAKTTKLMNRISSVSSVSIPEITTLDQFRGIESRRVFEKIENISETFNELAEHYGSWRSKFVKILTVKLIDQGEEDLNLTGEEYEESTKQQDEAYVYHMALRALLADRQCLVTGQVNALVNDETKAALKQATHGTRDSPEEKGHAPELARELLTIRLKLKASEDQDSSRSLRGIMTEVRSLLTALNWQKGEGRGRAIAEIAIAEEALKKMQQIFNEQTKVNVALEQELELCRSTMNQRLEYYKSLQEISDQVRSLDEDPTDGVNISRVQQTQEDENRHHQRVSTLKTKKRFLAHLRQETTRTANQERTCVICTSTFDDGILTVCGHQFCVDCMALWYRSHRNCPMCKKRLGGNEMHKITYKARDVLVQEEQQQSQEGQEDDGDSTANLTHHDATSQTIYSSISARELDEITKVELRGTSFGIKIDTIAQHLIWLRDNDPGSKSIIFSQYRDFLNVLGRALREFKISFTTVATKDGTEHFKSDPSIECFLLHAKADSSGLNLTNATHVFLCEPLINAALELQAIARVHRIGQRRATNVYMYLVSDTVEESIYEISVERRMAHLRRQTADNTSIKRISGVNTPNTNIDEESRPRENEQQLELANSLELQSTHLANLLSKGQSGGEIVDKDDLWRCLFAHSSAQRTNAGALNFLPSSSSDHEDLVAEMGRYVRADAAERRRNAGVS